MQSQLAINAPYHVYNQARFGKLVINGRGFIYLAISKMGFELSARGQGRISIKAVIKTDI